MKRTLLILFALFTILGYSQTTFTDSNYISYEVINNQPPYTVQVTGYDFANGGASVVIPSSVDYNSITYSVVVVGDGAFQGNASTGQITSVTIPNTVTFIGYNAFAYNALSTITIPDSVTTIGNLAFINNQLTSVTLSNTITNIPTGAFQGNDLTSITIPNSVTSIQNNAFFNNQLTAITIPPNVVSIAQRAFAGNPLTMVTCLGTTAPTVVYGASDPTIDSISYNRSNVDLIIPTGTISAYTAANWIGFNSVTESSTLGVSNFDLKKGIKIVASKSGIKIVASGDIKLKSYTLYNISGQKIKTDLNSKIPTGSVSNGIYILKLDFDKGQVTKKIMVY